MHSLLVLSWRTDPASEHPYRLVAMIGLPALVGLAAFFLTESVLMTVGFVLIAWAVAVWAHLPTWYCLDRYGVTVRRPGLTRYRPWTAIRRVARDDTGLLLSTHSQRRLFDLQHGLFLRFDKNGREVTTVVRAYLTAPRYQSPRAA